MDVSRAILLDVLNFLPLVESRIMGDGADVSDMLEILSLRQSLDLLDAMLSKCESTVMVDDFSFLRKRISVARETVEILATRSTPTRCRSEYFDAVPLCRELPDDSGCHIEYGRHLNMSNEEFDNLIEEWASDVGKGSSSLKCKRTRPSVGDQQDKIRSDLVKLADTMKSKALWYRDQLVKDNEVLSKYTAEQEKQLDTVAHVATEASNLTKAARLSVRQSIVMVVSMLFLLLLMMLIFIIT